MNSEAIITRLKTVLDFYSLTLSTFADTVEVQRSSLSHLMSGRNKPSLDFVLKVVDKYPEVDLYWLLNGKGSFPKTEETTVISSKTNVVSETVNSTPSLFSETEEKFEVKNETISSIPKIAQNEPQDKSVSNTRFSDNGKKLVKVMLLYNDGSFEEFNK